MSGSADKSIRVWSPIKQECVSVVQATKAGHRFHQAGINTFALHDQRQVCISGDLSGGVFYSNYMTGEIGAMLAKHDDSVESIEISPSENHPYCVSVAMDPHIIIYSLKDMQVRQKIKTDHNGFSKVIFS